MTKRLTIALIAVALFVVLAVLPAAAVSVNPDNFNGTQIDLGATVFIGEQGLNLTHAINAADEGWYSSPGNTLDNQPTNLTIGWWASAAQITTSAPTQKINLGPGGATGRYLNFQVAKDDFVGYTGNWYLLKPDGTVAQRGDGNNPVAVINVQDPKISVAAWDYSQNGKDVTGLSVPQGEHLGVKIDTNMYAATYANRNNTIFTETGLAIAGFVPTSPVLPNGNEAPVNDPVGLGQDTNYTGYYNGSFAYRTTDATKIGLSTLVTPTMYPVAAVTGEVWTVRNYTCAATAAMTTYGRPVGTYSTAYFNNSPVIGTGDWTAQNFTTDAQGTVAASTNGDGMWGTQVINGVANLVPNAGTDGYIHIRVKDETGATYSSLIVGDHTDNVYNTATVSLLRQFVNSANWIFGTSTHDATHVGYWVTDALTANGQYAYPVGTYSIWAESILNNMKDNYKNAGADYTGKTISATGTVTLVSDTVKIEANKDSVVRSKSFSITVTGKPQTTYYVWVKGSSSMTGGYDNQAPMIAENQDKVYFDRSAAINYAADPVPNAQIPFGSYHYENGGGHTADTTGRIWDDVSANTTAQINGKTRYYALINTSVTGTRTVEFVTTNWTKAQKYTIRVEQTFPATTSGYGGNYLDTANSYVKSDEVDVNVEKGAVTIVAAGDQSYYLGEEIKFSGTNTESYRTYLFLVGPNLPPQGTKIDNTDPRNYVFAADGGTTGVRNGNAATFKVVEVNGDNTWSWKWGTATVALDAGTYTIYAVSSPNDKDTLQNSAYGTVSVIIKKPFVSATASQSTVAKGDNVFITGTAQGDPNNVAIWIMSKNYATRVTEAVNSDASFKYEITRAMTTDRSSGQYFVVVQHPMQNTLFDVDLDTSGGTTNGYVINRQLKTTGGNIAQTTTIFKLLGASSLQGSDAAEALAEGINNANVDDTYTKLQFLIEEPLIRIDAVGDKHVGDKFTITAQTNLAVDDEILVQVYSSSFKPTQKSQSGEFSGATGTVKVTKGDSGMNKISFDVDSSTFKPDEYIVTEQAVLITTATGNALFNVLETTAATVAPTKVVTAAPTAVQTAAPTAVQTAAPTAVPTTKSPGFGALIALIGLGAVAFVVVRRH